MAAAAKLISTRHGLYVVELVAVCVLAAAWAGFNGHRALGQLEHYSFRSSGLDVALLAIARGFVVTAGLALGPSAAPRRNVAHSSARGASKGSGGRPSGGVLALCLAVSVAALAALVVKAAMFDAAWGPLQMALLITAIAMTFVELLLLVAVGCVGSGSTGQETAELAASLLPSGRALSGDGTPSALRSAVRGDSADSAPAGAHGAAGTKGRSGKRARAGSGSGVGDSGDEQADDEPRPPKTATLRRMLKLAGPECGLLLVATIALLVTTGSTLAIPAFVGQMINVVSDTKSQAELNHSTVALVIVLLIGALFTFVRGTLFTLAGERVVARLRKVLFQSIVRQDIAFFDDNKTGELLNRLSSDTQVIQSAITTNVSMALRFGSQALVGMLILFFVSWRLTLVMLGVVPAVVIAAVLYGRRLRDLGKQYQDALAKASDVAEEALGQVRTVRAFNMELLETRRYGDAVSKSYGVGRSKSFMYGGFAGVIGAASYGAIVLVLWFGGKQVIEGRIKAGTLIEFTLLTVFIAVAFGAMSGLYGNVMTAVGASERIFRLIDKAPRDNGVAVDEDDSPGGPGDDAVIPYPTISATRCTGLIEFKNVWFRYPCRPDVQVLKDVSFSVRPGETVALVGRSGSGKSTMVSLLEMFYPPSSGLVMVDSCPVSDHDPAWLRSNMAIVSQNPVLFARSVGDNIRFGKPLASQDEVESAARAANAHDFIMSFPDGYDTMVGERGVRLSGGQMQRIAIARALLMDPAILLLDEATSSLDAEAEAIVSEAIDRLMGESRSTIVIAHRLSTVRDADCVLVVDKGRIAESGTHDELVAANGIYKQLVERQLSRDRTERDALTGSVASATPTTRSRRDSTSPTPDGGAGAGAPAAAAVRA